MAGPLGFWLTIGDVDIPPVSHAFIVDAFEGMEGLEGPAIRGWWPTAAETVPMWWYAAIRLYARNEAETSGLLGNVVEGLAPSESHVVVIGETARLLDAVFADSATPDVTISDGVTLIRPGKAQLHTRTLVKPAKNPGQSVWIYEFTFYSADTYRTSTIRRHAWLWSEVMLDTYPLEGSPLTEGPTLYDAAAETTYVHANNVGVSVPVYDGEFDVQMDSGCRYSLSLASVSGGRGELRVWERVPPRFWTLAEALKVAADEWENHGGRVIFGGRIAVDDLAGNLPKTFTVEYQLPTVPPSPPPPPSEYSYTTNAKNASGEETVDLGNVYSDSAIGIQTERLVEWETHKRRHFVTVFSGLVPWRMTPLDSSIEWRFPIDGVQKPVTILYGTEARTDVAPTPTVENPTPAGGQITVTFNRPASPTTGHDTVPTGYLTRDGYGSSPPFVPPAMSGTTASFVYDSLADGSYTVAPGSPWSPTTATVTVVDGSTHTMTFNYV